MTKAEERKRLIEEVIEMATELDYLEYKLPMALDKLRKLNPTKREIEDNDLQDLFDVYL